MSVQQTNEEFKKHLKEQIDFLLRSAKAYDGGFTAEAKRMTVSIRVLLHDTQNSTSLLTLLGKKDIGFYDTAHDYKPNVVTPHMGLIKMYIKNTGEWGYSAPLDNRDFLISSRGKLSFDAWWNKIVFVDSNRNKLTRKDLVLSVANKDGGAHIDPELNQAYADLTRSGSLGWKCIFNDKEIEPATDPEKASIRQICYEVLKSFEDEFPEHFK